MTEREELRKKLEEAYKRLAFEWELLESRRGERYVDLFFPEEQPTAQVEQ